MKVYSDLGVKRVINALGPMTIIGSALVRPDVAEAMAEAARWHVDVIELQRAAGRRLAELVGVEACYIAGGCAAGLAIAAPASRQASASARTGPLRCGCPCCIAILTMALAWLSPHPASVPRGMAAASRPLQPD